MSTPTNTPTSTPARLPTGTPTPLPTDASTLTNTPTIMPTALPTDTLNPMLAHTPSPTPTDTPAPSSTATPTPQPGIILDADFEAGANGFGHSDDAFRVAHQPGHASGVWTGSGDFSGGALRVELGGNNDDDILNMSGGWQRSFTSGAATEVVLSFRCRLTQAPDYESDEHS